MPYRILLRRDNSLNWTYNDPVLMTGEPGYETDTNKFKIGDGQTPWSQLDYYIGTTGDQGPIGVTGPAGPAGGPTGPTGSQGPAGVFSGITGYYASYVSQVDQSALAINTGYPMEAEVELLSNGISIISNSQITFEHTGSYIIRFSSQMLGSLSGTTTFDIWLRKNGTEDLEDSTGKIQTSSINPYAIAGWDYTIEAEAGDYYEFMWATTNLSSKIDYSASTSVHPSIPSVAIDVSQIAYNGNIGPTGATGPSSGSGTGANTYYGDQTITSGNKLVVNTIEEYSGNTLTLNSQIIEIPEIFRILNYSSLNFTDDSGASAGGVPTGGIYHNNGAIRIRLS